jgi:hypothetical protein
MAKHHKKSTIKREPINTLNPGPVTLTDSQMEILDNIVHHWNLAAPNRDPQWDVSTALAELARLNVIALTADYGDDERTPAFEAPPEPNTEPQPEHEPLDPGSMIV